MIKQIIETHPLQTINLHTHSHFCDGEGDPEVYILEAIQRGMTCLGFTSHAPVPFSTVWHMPSDQLNAYFERLSVLKQQYQQQIRVCIGLEIDYIPGMIGPASPVFDRPELEYNIGSVHYVHSFEDGEPWVIDSYPHIFQRGLEEIYKGDIQQVVTHYYEILQQMLRDEPPSIIGHLDLIKKNNTDSKYFDEKEAWYQRLVDQTLDEVQKSDCILEINTRGLATKKTQDFYPSALIIDKCIKREIPLLISSDAHQAGEVNVLFEEAGALLKL